MKCYWLWQLLKPTVLLVMGSFILFTDSGSYHSLTSRHGFLSHLSHEGSHLECAEIHLCKIHQVSASLCLRVMCSFWEWDKAVNLTVFLQMPLEQQLRNSNSLSVLSFGYLARDCRVCGWISEWVNKDKETFMTEVLSNLLRTRTSRPTSEDKPLNGQTAVLTMLPRPVQRVRYATLKRQKLKKENF